MSPVMASTNSRLELVRARILATISSARVAALTLAIALVGALQDIVFHFQDEPGLFSIP